MNILAVIILHQHEFCVYKGKRKLRLLVKSFCFLKNLFRLENVEKKCGKKVYSQVVFEMVSWVTVNTAFCFFTQTTIFITVILSLIPFTFFVFQTVQFCA